MRSVFLLLLLVGELFTTEEHTLLDNASKEELIELVKIFKKENARLCDLVVKLDALQNYKEQERLKIGDEYHILRHRIFGKSSEKRPEKKDISRASTHGRSAKKCLPSLRYPDAPLVEQDIDFEKTPHCGLCEAEMVDMGVTENSEMVTLTEKTYHVLRQKKHKYRCPQCHGDVKTAKAPPRIKPGSGFSDELAIDVVVSKYADHIPVERYATIAERNGLVGINPQSLIGLTHHVGDALVPVVERIKSEVQEEKVLSADETFWRMLEDEKPNWFLWGFFGPKAAYYEAQDTRAGRVATEFIKNSKAKYLLSDAFSGYSVASKETGVINCYCNAHSRRKFVEAELNYPAQANPVINYYKELYHIENQIRGRPPDEILTVRQQESAPVIKSMEKYLMGLEVLPQSAIGKARSYAMKHWVGLTRFLEDGAIPIDNNHSERSLRNPVVGRKMWYGNHSRRGVATTARLFTVVESCKLNKLDPSRYLKDTLGNIVRGKSFCTPAEFTV